MEAQADHPLYDEVASQNYLNPNQQRLVKDDIENLEQALLGRPMQYVGNDPVAGEYVPTPGNDSPGSLRLRPDPPPPDPEVLQDALRRDRFTWHKGMPRQYSGEEKNWLYKKYKEEIEVYKEGYLSHGQCWNPTIAHVNMVLWHNERNKKREKFLMNVRRIFEPQDDLFHPDVWRPDDPTPLNFRQYQLGYEQVAWTPQEDVAEHVATLDDALYRQFLELKTVVQDSSVIKLKLQCDQATYDACEARLAVQREALELETQSYDAPMPEESQELAQLITAIHAEPGIGYRDLMTQLGKNPTQLNELLREAQNADLIQQDPESKGWSLTTEEW